ncbi:RagB/SusD family nutrient uptake outer membrane protein [Flaviaesturariibacter flavus]|uniref:RagB/SusD family nutrient uptake outer membrane protein n=1 Tax=Flaviaesturariibacter flavus TaxID=2502780 RepID=A0A4R1BB51_9BACT|nr:RagB/SusD family nutrient uptake outer membrane protein [Flaviaesturariibacter flavus]TCJ14221.1 RagB/SusD family nutrient uptake outer membrane protein [Flaviaesturariibacter flavus]
MKAVNPRKLTIAALVALALAGGGCHKFLDRQPITEQSPEAVFSSVQGAYGALISAYSRLVGDNGYGIRLSLYYTVDNDEMQGPTGNVGTSDNDRRDIARYAATAGNAQIAGPFNQLFQGIEFANQCIDNIPNMALYASGSEQEQKQLRRMYGEALTLRAQFYFEAIRNWGDLPAHFQSASKSAGATPYPARVDRDTLYDRIIADLRVAEDLVPWRNELAQIGDAPNERITKGTVKGLRARIALFRGGYSLRNSAQMERRSDYLTYYTIARQEASEIMASGQHSLNPSFRGLWKDQVCARVSADPNGELMFQASGVGQAGAEDTKLGYYNGPTVGGTGNRAINVLPTYFYAFQPGDLRRDVTCAPYIVGADGRTKTGQVITSINDGKYRRDWITPEVAANSQAQYFSLKWQILRYADVLLMFAEADNEVNNGPSAAAYEAVNMVRRRGFGKPLNTPDATVDLPAGLSKTDFFNAIVRERSLELGGEGVRKFDLIRWNLLAAKISETKQQLTQMSTASGIYANLPARMYYRTNIPTGTPPPIQQNTGTADDSTLWANSFYAPTPSSAPANATALNWVVKPTSSAPVNAIGTTALARFALGFQAGRSELLPIPQAARDANPALTQNPGY